MGFAWAPNRYDNKMVFRGGFGISYDRIPETLLLNSSRQSAIPGELRTSVAEMQPIPTTKV